MICQKKEIKLILTLKIELCFKHNTNNHRARKKFINTFLIPILHTLIKEDLTGYLVLMYSSSESSEEISMSSVTHLIAKFYFSTYLHSFKTPGDNSFHLLQEQNQLILLINKYN